MRSRIVIDPAASIAHALPIGITFDLTAEQYASDWTLPQFYFHVMTAYAILRAQGTSLERLTTSRTCLPICAQIRRPKASLLGRV